MKPSIMIASDLDGTALPGAHHKEDASSANEFFELVASGNVCFVSVSGRSLELTTQAVAQHDLPTPHIAICNVGATIWERGRDDDWRMHTDWNQKNRDEWQQKSWYEMRELFSNVDGIQLQKQYDPSICKLSYEADARIGQGKLVEQLLEIARQNSIEVAVSYCLDVNNHDLALIDVLAKTGTKLHAIQEVARVLGYQASQVIAAGDSGNDLSFLTAGWCKSVLVANAHQQVKDQLLQHQQQSRQPHDIFFAQGEKGICRGGILQGVRHFFPHLF